MNYSLIKFTVFLCVSTSSHSFLIEFPSRRRHHRSRSFFTSLFDGGIGIGIDLGTTYSAVAYLEKSDSISSVSDGVPIIIPVKGSRTIPSVISFDLERVGYDAVDEVDAYRNVKRVIGTGGRIEPQRLDKTPNTVVPHLVINREGKTYKKLNLPNKIYDAQHYPTLLRHVKGELISPEKVSQRLLRELVEAAELHTGEKVERAVIGIPAYFNDAQREATVRAAQAAGIQKVKLLREPEAAALAYGAGKEESGYEEDELVLVFDLGGGTFDVSMLVVGGGLTEIISTSGNAQLGGTNFDERIAEEFQSCMRKEGASTNTWGEQAQTNLLLVAEAARIQLSNQKSVKLVLPLNEESWRIMKDPSAALVSDGDDAVDDGKKSDDGLALHFRLTRKRMESLCQVEFQEILRPVREVAIMSGAMLPGDSSPSLVEAALEFEENLDQEFPDFYHDDLKAVKKSQQKGRKKSRDLAKLERKFRNEKRKIDADKVEDGISGRPISRVVLVGGATRMLAIGKILEALTGVKPQKTVNPDEAVALGCAVHVGVLDGGERTVLNPMQAAILRALAEQKGIHPSDSDFEKEEFY